MRFRPLLGSVLSLAFAITAEATAGPEAFVGNWGLTMSNGNAGWLTIDRVNGEWTGQLWTTGQTRVMSNITYTFGWLTFDRNCRVGAPEFPGGEPTGEPVPCHFIGTMFGEDLRLVMKIPDNGRLTHFGKRLPPMPPKPDLSTVKFGEPIQLFNGEDLTGWQLSNAQQINGWRADKGVLVNEPLKNAKEPFSRYGNLRTVESFGDQKLHIEFNVPEGGDSGIYLRGAYETQVVDRDSSLQGFEGVGAIFDRVKPTKNAGKAGGEWQTFDITIVDRHATVVLNGETVIDNEPIRGNTDGAFQADITAPGPLYLQGDHSAVKFRNIVVYPVIAAG